MISSIISDPSNIYIYIYLHKLHTHTKNTCICLSNLNDIFPTWIQDLFWGWTNSPDPVAATSGGPFGISIQWHEPWHMTCCGWWTGDPDNVMTLTMPSNHYTLPKQKGTKNYPQSWNEITQLRIKQKSTKNQPRNSVTVCNCVCVVFPAWFSTHQTSTKRDRLVFQFSYTRAQGLTINTGTSGQPIEWHGGMVPAAINGQKYT